TVASVVDVAAAVDLVDIAREGAPALEPYAGRGVLNGGAVTFHGAVDDHIYRARHALGDGDADRWRHTAESAYRRIGARWWQRTLGASPTPVKVTEPARPLWLRRDDSGRWTVGMQGTTFALSDLRGLRYLRYLIERPGVDIDA